MPNKYTIKAKGPKAAEVLIYGDIGENWWSDTSVDAATFVKNLQELSAEDLTVRINSYGGSVSDGIAIYNAIKRHTAKTTVCIDGVAVSIASLIAMAGDTVQMAENALMMIHAPWGFVSGNSADLRDMAETLDKYAQAMSSSYAQKTGKAMDEVMGWLTDGQDHWFTAQEAQDLGLVDELTSAVQIAAHANLSRFKPPAAAAAFATPKEIPPMPKEDPKAQAAPNQPPAIPTTPAAAPEPVDTAAIVAQALQAENQRRNDVRGVFAKFRHIERVQPVMDACLDDPQASVAVSNERLLKALGEGAESFAASYVPRIEMGLDERQKFIEAGTNAIMARGAVPGIKMDGGNPFRGMRMLDIARASLDRAGIKHQGMDVRAVVAAAFTQTTSDFPVLLENTLNKTLLAAWATAPDTWRQFCKQGSVSDFRANNRYRVGSIGNLDSLNEAGEFRNKAIPDGEKASITAGTKGNLINISRQAVINDDLNAFVDLAMALGRAGMRTIESSVYALLASNPTMVQDGKALFHADHANLAGTGTGVTVAAIEAARQAMMVQKDVGGNDYIDLTPAIFVGGVAKASDARVVNEAQYDTDVGGGSSTKNPWTPNRSRGFVQSIVESPRITGNEWYLLADPNIAPAIEVAFLDGVQEPYLELQNGFEVDGATWKVRLDFGVAPLEWRSIYKNPGA